MEATLTELRRDTSRIMRAVQRGEEVLLTEHQTPVARIVPYVPLRVADVEEARAASLSDESILEAVRGSREDYTDEIAGAS